jgi:predicted nuclease of predicted toxin-antitoxin system
MKKDHTDKLYEVFLRRYRRFWDDARSGPLLADRDIVKLWDDWLGDSEGFVHVKKVGNLLELINEPGFNRIVIQDPRNDQYFIILDRDFAEKVLVLGDVP